MKSVELLIPLPADVLAISRIFRAAGHLLYVVGGAVRDRLLGLTPKDFDLATDAPPQRVGRVLGEAGVRNFPKGEAFGVWVAHFAGTDYEIATFREDLGTGDGRRPKAVGWTSAAGDARRRDLTINALFYEIPTATDQPGKVLDFFDGQALDDVATGTVRVVGDPYERFGEDRLRILRIPRFHARFWDRPLDLDSYTRDAINTYLPLRAECYRATGLGWDFGTRIGPISGERIQQEFERGLLTAKSTAAYLKNYQELGLLREVFPNLDVEQCFDLLTDPETSKNTKVVLAFLLRHNEAPKVTRTLNTLNWPNSTTDEVGFLLKALAYARNKRPTMVKMATEMESKEGRRADAVQFGRLLGPEVDQDVWGHFCEYRRLKCSGEEIMREHGLPPGPAVGAKITEMQNDHYQRSFSDYMKVKGYSRAEWVSRDFSRHQADA